MIDSLLGLVPVPSSALDTPLVILFDALINCEFSPAVSALQLVVALAHGSCFLALFELAVARVGQRALFAVVFSAAICVVNKTVVGLALRTAQ